MKWTLLKWSADWGEPLRSSPEMNGYLIGKRLRVGYTERSTFRQVEGVVTKVNLFAILLDVGKASTVQYVEWEWISSVEELAPVIQVPKIIIRKLAIVDEQTVRQHLADRHGWQVDSIPDDPVMALGVHAAHHMGGGLGHAHPIRDGLQTPTADDIAARTEELNTEYEHALDCDSCGYVRLPEEPGKKFKTMLVNDQRIMHCENCWDLDEFTYLS